MPTLARSCAPALLALALLACFSSAQAQFGGGGGKGGGGGMSGGVGGMGGPRGGGEKSSKPNSSKRETDERDRPEPLRAWLGVLQQARPALRLTAEQDEPMNALLRDLRDLAELNERRRERAMGFGRPVVSAIVDIDRDLRLEEEALAEHAAAYADVRRFLRNLQAALSAEQYEAVLQSYRKSQLLPVKPA